MQIEVHKLGRDTHEMARRLARHVGGNLRAPHHSVSEAGLIGELAIAAGGVLMLDEIDEFRGNALRVLKDHLERMQDSHRPVLFVTHSGELTPATQEFLDDLRKFSDENRRRDEVLAALSRMRAAGEEFVLARNAALDAMRVYDALGDHKHVGRTGPGDCVRCGLEASLKWPR